ncbi:alpha-glucosidase/trehalose-6-phosphate hydrolase [Metamycoplasma subdolum]|uniref:Alpha-glucosidase/trehalose-6-phosphate hydrolase n=1 Tax=Metamycoplasma subdolum TaxID=92407 RepID=A0A3L9ZYS3_9BACT|nr:glucan 1,6-alpha-glucosidase [Metamycoplasma subdolum]RMA77527.1 alpha-glucosidase/trehalose-6-phosphate hydrolase [Metamycoplasma subdolum]WPB50720.1 hypothetical protein R9C05_01045 [Metamycoplasma subdolum]
MQETKKLFIYELKLQSFRDISGSGIGDFAGLYSKIHYFEFLKFNTICIDDVLKPYENAFSLEDVNQKYGSLNDFVTCVLEFNKKGIELSPTIDIKKLKQAFINWSNLMNLYKRKKEENPALNVADLTALDTYILNERNQTLNIVELANSVLYFDKIINFYLQCGVKTFTILNFEDLIATHNFTYDFHYLQDFYRMIKRLEPDAYVILKTNKNNYKMFKQMLKLKIPCLDYLYLTHLPKLSLAKELPFSKKGALKPNLFFQNLRHYINNPKFIISLSSDEVGRLSSRWGDEKAFNFEATKSFMCLLFSLKSSFAIYYGDELGQIRANIKGPSDFKDLNYNEEKRFYESKGISKETYFLARSILDPISQYTNMAWSAKTNSGFSVANISKNLNSLNWQKNNVNLLTNDLSSPLNFTSFLFELFEDENLKKALNKGKIRTNCFFSNGLIKIKRQFEKTKIYFLINLTNKPVRCPTYPKLKILASSYAHKMYADMPNKLDPFESIILVSDDKVIKKENIVNLS